MVCSVSKTHCLDNDEFNLSDDSSSSITEQTILDQQQQADPSLDYDIQDSLVPTKISIVIPNEEIPSLPKYSDSLGLKADKAVQEASLVCISVYSRHIKGRQDLQYKVDSKLKEMQIDEKEKAMIVEKYIISTIARCVIFFVEYTQPELQAFLQEVYANKFTDLELERL